MEGDKQATDDEKLVHISIHALRVEGDNFADTVYQRGKISIHALRVEGDMENGI